MLIRTLVELLVLVIGGVGYVCNDAYARLTRNRKCEQRGRLHFDREHAGCGMPL